MREKTVKLLRKLRKVINETLEAFDEPIPEGTYLCKVASVTHSQLSSHENVWILYLEIAEGEFEGSYAASEEIRFSWRGKDRREKIFKALGMSSDERPESLIGRTAMVDLREDLEGNFEVPYDGWKPIPESDS